jgi:predicted ATPase/class 3 adenylate cyclase
VTTIPSGTVTFLFTDIEGSTQLWESAQDAMQSALEQHDRLLRASIDAHGGYVFATGGDGFGVAFARAGDALAAAWAMQQALGDASWPQGAALRARMGMHTGEASERDGDYFGPALNRAARLMAAAHGGQAVCTNATAALADQGVALRDLGEHRLRDLAAPVHVFQLGTDVFPALRTVDAVPTNLPTVRTDLIGRSDDLEALSELVRNERLVTLTGTGGVGKTRLALGVAAVLAPDFADGCWVIELAPLSDGEEVVGAVASAMRAPVTTHEALVAYLSDRRMLLVLDNCEHVLDASADLVDAIVAAAPEIHLVTTSREPLGIDGERVRRVQSLALPTAEDTHRTAAAAPAIRLFEERAQAADEAFRIDEGNLGAVVEICRQLDGIPLAIELAAARTRSMAPPDIASRLHERFRLLGGGSRRAQERHRTLLAAVSWSHDLLSDEERATFRRLSVFPASFDLRAAEAVAGGDGIDVVDAVLRLVDRSLVSFDPSTQRYGLLETLRQYGADRLAEAAETTDTRALHAEHFLNRARELHPLLDGPGYHTGRAQAHAESENLRATGDWCMENGRWTDLATMCQQLWYYLEQDRSTECPAWFGQLLDHHELLPGELSVAIAGDFAWLETSVFGRLDAAILLAERSHALAEANGVPTSAVAWNSLTQAKLYSGRFDEALRDSDRGLEQAEAIGAVREAVTAGCIRMVVLDILGERERSLEVAGAALRDAQQTAHPILVAAAVISMVGTYVTARAEPDFESSYELLNEHDLSVDSGGLNDNWRDLMWGMTLLGLGKPGAIERLAAAARGADRSNAGHILDSAVRELAVAAGRGGLAQEAVTLAAYAEDNLRSYRFDNPGQIWIQADLDEVLAAAKGFTPKRGIGRSDLMALIDDVELVLTQQQPST